MGSSQTPHSFLNFIDICSQPWYWQQPPALGGWAAADVHFFQKEKSTTTTLISESLSLPAFLNQYAEKSQVCSFAKSKNCKPFIKTNIQNQSLHNGETHWYGISKAGVTSVPIMSSYGHHWCVRVGNAAKYDVLLPLHMNLHFYVHIQTSIWCAITFLLCTNCLIFFTKNPSNHCSV